MGEAPGSAYLCRGALRARNPAGARRCSGVARGRPGQAGRASWLAGCSLPAAGTGKAPASSPVGGGRGGSRGGGGGSNRHRGAGTPAAAAEEEVSARDSRFLLPGRASAGEARGGLNPGSPNSVPRDLRGGRDAPSSPTAPCDSARAAWPRRASHSRATAAAVQSTAVSLPSLSLPSRAVHPQPAPGQPASAPRGCRGAAAPSPGAGSWPDEYPGLRGRGTPRLLRPSRRDVRSNPVLSSLFIAGGTASRAPGLRGSQQVALPARSSLPCGSLVSSLRNGQRKTAHNTGRWPSLLEALPDITPSSRPGQGVH